MLNKASNRTGIRAEDVEKNIQRKVAFQIGDAGPDITFSINQGVPLVIGKPTHQVVRDIVALAKELGAGAKASEPIVAGQAPVPEKKPGLFSRLSPRR